MEHIQKFEDITIIMILLWAIPNSYSGFVESLLGSNDLIALKLDDTILRMKDSESFRHDGQSSGAMVMTTK